MKTKNILLIIAAVFLLGVIAMLVGCNSKPQYIPPTTVEVIEQQFNPAIDSLKQDNALLKDSVLKLNKALEVQKKEQQFASRKASATIGKLQEALAAKDTGKIIVYSEDAAEEFTAFKEEVAKQDSIQDRIIYMQGIVIENNRGEIELHESKFKELKRAYNVQEIQIRDFAKENKKLQRKLQRSKFFNKVLGIGTAAGAVLAGIVFL